MKQEKLSIRKIKASETKEKIYQCAAQLFREYGFENVTVDSIVEEAGISKGTFYVHFKSKDALLADLITEYVNESDLDYKNYLKAFPPEKDKSEILLSLIGRISDNITCRIGYKLIQLAYRIQIDRTIDMDMMLNYNREIYRIFSYLIESGIQKGEFKPETPAGVLADHFVMAIRGLTYEWCIRYPNFDLKSKLLLHFDILLSGIRTEKSTSKFRV